MLAVLVALLLVLGVGGELSAQPKAAPLPFKIGVVTQLSGPGVGFGKRGVMGIRFRIEEEINKAGGINGHPVQLFIYDDGTKPDQAAMLVERAATVDKVFAILGPQSSANVSAAFPTAVRLGIPDITMAGMLRGLCERNAPWCFSTMMSEDFSMKPLELLIDKFKIKNAVVMADAKYSYAVGQAEWAYKLLAEKGVKVLHAKGKLDVESGWPDFTPQITQLKSLRPDLIVPGLWASDMARFAIGLKGAGMGANVMPIFSGYFLEPEFVVASGESAEGWYGSGEIDLQTTDPEEQVWQKKLTDYGKSISNDPGVYTVQYNQAAAYDAASFLCEAIRRTKITPDTPLQEARLKIRDELPKIKMKTYSSAELRFGEGGKYEKNRLVKPVFLFQVKGGKMVRVGEI